MLLGEKKMENLEYDLGYIVEMKKEHPCEKRSKRFEIVRMGADIKIKCLGCGNVLMLTRHTFNKSLKKVIEKGDNK